jgi:hypothetical protein
MSPPPSRRWWGGRLTDWLFQTFDGGLLLGALIGFASGSWPWR